MPEAWLIGKGNEGVVFEHRDDRVVTIYQHASAVELALLSDCLMLLARQKLPNQTPEIRDIGRLDVTSFTIERRLPGKSFEGRVGALSQIGRACHSPTTSYQLRLSVRWSSRRIPTGMGCPLEKTSE